MVQEQQSNLYTLFHRATETGTMHLGDCIGADEEAREIAASCGWITIGHPPTNPQKRAFGRFDTRLAPKNYLLRNRDIVNACELLIAAPLGAIHDHCRHGTCATVRYARSVGRDIIILEGGDK
jgi:hypothetical protein